MWDRESLSAFLATTFAGSIGHLAQNTLPITTLFGAMSQGRPEGFQYRQNRTQSRAGVAFLISSIAVVSSLLEPIVNSVIN
jgi:hypothetical protein